MNTKNSKGIIGITLALIMIASVFAAIAPSTTADVKAAADFSTAKETLDATGTFVDPTMTYQVGDTVHYIVNYTNTDPTFNCTLDLWDIFPDGTIHNFGNDIFFTVGQKRSYTVDYIVKASDVQPPSGLITYNHITNTARAQGLNGNSEVIDDTSTKISEILEEQLPELNFTWKGIGCFEVEFNGSASIDPDGNISNHTWSYGDGATSGVIFGPPGIVSHIYLTCGPKTVKLSGYDDRGNSAEKEKEIYVDCGPTAIAYATPSCFEAGNDSIIFNGSASHADLNNTAYPQSIVNWSWSFSDSGHGSSDNAAVTSRVVNDTVTATLTVRDSLG
jgi:hypothetical protein